MSALYSGLGIDADLLLKEFGFQVTHRKKAFAAYNTTTGASPSTPTDVPRWAVVDDSSSTRQDDSNTFENEVKLIMSALPAGNQPAEDDHVLVKGVEYSIKKLNSLDPGGVVVLYRITLRRVGVG